jgi:hypothetical protein
MEGAVTAEEGGFGDEAAECDACGGGADDVGGEADPQEDLPEEIVAEIQKLRPRRLRLE